VLATVVDTDALWQTIVSALIAAVGVTLIFSIAIRGAARYADYSREGRALAATFSGAVAILGLLATAATIVIGVIVMASK
jgi:hypothetical protein